MFRIGSSVRYCIWVLIAQLFIQASASTSLHRTNPSLAAGKRSKIHTSNTADNEIIIVSESIPLSSSSSPQFYRRGVASQTPIIGTTNCQGKLQKRGQCLSSLQRNPARTRSSSSRSDGNRNQAAQQSSSQIHQQPPVGRSSRTTPQQTSIDRPRSPLVVPPSPSLPITQPSTTEHARQPKPSAGQRNPARPLQSARPRLQRALTLPNPARSKNQPRPTLPEVQSAPSLSNMPSVQAHAMAVRAASVAEQKAKSVRKTTVDLRQKTRATLAAVTDPYPSHLPGTSRAEERLRRHQQVVTDGRAFARQLNRSAISYSKAAEASQAAANGVRTDRNRIKAEWSRADSDTWKSISKTYSYSVQGQQQRLRDRVERRRIYSAPDPRRLALYGNIQPLLRMHDIQSESRQGEFTAKWEDASSLVRDNARRTAQLGEAGGYESDEPRSAQENIPEARLDDLPIRPYTPSPASSRGRSDTDEGPRRTSDSSSRPE